MIPSTIRNPPSAIAFGLLAVTACARPQPPERPAQEPEIRVALSIGSDRVVVGGQGNVAAVTAGTPAFTIEQDQPVTVVSDGRALVVDGGSEPARYESLTFVSLTPGRFVTLAGKPFRGVMEAFVRNGRLTAVNRLPVEDYLLGVVTAEMGRRTGQEVAALRAQAVVSRTYALRNRGRFSGEGYDLRATVADQAYGGVEAESPEGAAAVRGTTGEVLTYGGQLITALFHSTCGFRTATPGEVFRSFTNEPYLRSVSDARPGGYYCDISPRFRWRVEWDAATLGDILRRTLPEALGIDAQAVDVVREVRVARTGSSGRATEVRVRVGRGEIPVFGPDIRAVLATPEGRPLGSTAVQLTMDHVGDGSTRLTAAGAGWGHGVGMCQWGAVGRARAGQSHEQILTAYFSGVRLERLY